MLSLPCALQSRRENGASVQAVARDGLASYLVPRLSSQARSELIAVQNILNAWTPNPGIDERSSPLESSDHRLMTSKLYRLVTSVIDACAHFNFIWQNHALPKVKFFAWLLLQEHIQCKSNLKKKNILDTDVCELCNQSAETTSHLISGCSFAQRFWRHLGWEPLIIPPAADLWKIQAQAGAPTDPCPPWSSFAAGTSGSTPMTWSSDAGRQVYRTYSSPAAKPQNSGAGACLLPSVEM